MTRKRKILIGIGILLILIIGMFAHLITKIGKEVPELTYTDVTLTAVKDGVFVGETVTNVVSAKVEVEVKDHQIIRIDILEHKNGLGGAAEAIVDDMIEKNTYQVDAVSGATTSSNVIKSAVNKALEEGQE